MKRMMLMGLLMLLVLPLNSVAGEFDWMKDFNLKAVEDPAGLTARLEARFKIGEAKIKAILETVEHPADAYTLFRLGEMCKQPMDQVMKKYQANKGKGWGVLAKSLGIKPGSKEFHELKQGQDLYDDRPQDKGRPDKEEKGKGKGKKK